MPPVTAMGESWNACGLLYWLSNSRFKLLFFKKNKKNLLNKNDTMTKTGRNTKLFESIFLYWYNTVFK